jgi:probable HAF family extracellular repeat protein
MLSVLLGISLIGCGGRPAPVISVGVSPTVFTVSSPSAVVQVGTTAQFYANVTGDPHNAGVNWTVTCPATSCGSISPTSTANQGATTYMPPPSVPGSNLTVTLTAASISEAAAQGATTIIVPSVAVTVAPITATVASGGATQFTATVSGDSADAGVSWILAYCRNGGAIGQVCEHPPQCECGTISNTKSGSGIPITYTAPAPPPLGGQLTLTATSVANSSAFTAAPITLSSSSNSSAVNAGDAALRDFQAVGILKFARQRHSLPFFPQSPQAPREPQRDGKQTHYKVINLGTLGGSASNGFGGPNNRGWVTGDANLAGDQTEHAFLWRDRVMMDLGTLGGLNSGVPTPVKNSRGLITGVAQTAIVDPLKENWGKTFICGSGPCKGFRNVVSAFLWQDGIMTPLPTLGGNNSGSLGANNKGQVVGGAETAIQDPSCVPPQKLLVDAVIWGPKLNEIHILPPFPGDPIGVAVAINDKAEVVGLSGVCEGPGLFLTGGVHAVLWRHGKVTDLGNLGGNLGNNANAINNRGQVVGQSALSGNTFTHAFLWQDGVMTDLGTLPGDSNSTATDINNKGQVVGVSCDATFTVCRAFLWEDDVMTDLNALIPRDSPLFLTFGAGINDRGEIAGTAFDASTGEAPAFLVVPCDERHADVDGCRDHD